MTPLSLTWENKGKVWSGSSDGIHAVFTREPYPQGVCIQLIYVPRHLRRKGIGTAALQATIQKIKQEYPDEAIITLAMSLEPKEVPLDVLVRLYERFSFTPIWEDKKSKLMAYCGNDEERQAILEAREEIARRRGCSDINL